MQVARPSRSLLLVVPFALAACASLSGLSGSNDGGVSGEGSTGHDARTPARDGGADATSPVDAPSHPDVTAPVDAAHGDAAAKDASTEDVRTADAFTKDVVSLAVDGSVDAHDLHDAGSAHDASFTHDAGATHDASLPPPTFCSMQTGVLWCEDFDEGLTAATFGAGVVVEQSLGTLDIVAMSSESGPNSLHASLLATASGQGYATLAKTVAIPTSTAPFTASVGVYFAAPFGGLNAAAFVVTSGDTTVTSDFAMGTGEVELGWEYQMGDTSFENSGTITVGTYHTLTVSCAAGTFQVFVDGVQTREFAATPGSTVNVQVGLLTEYNASYQNAGDVYFDNLLVTSP